jgi:hypothetical protein
MWVQVNLLQEVGGVKAIVANGWWLLPPDWKALATHQLNHNDKTKHLGFSSTAENICS